MYHYYNPETFREMGHQLVDRLADHLTQSLNGDRKVVDWQDPEARKHFWANLLKSPNRQFQPLVELVLDQSISLHHPGYMGHQNAPPLPLASLVDLLVSALNSSAAVYEMGPAATMAELAVTRWMCDQIGFSLGGGVFTSGGSLANLTALLCARQSVVGGDIWNAGVSGRKPLAVLASAFSHYSITKACQIMGLGKNALITVPYDEHYRLDPRNLDRALDGAIKNGFEVFAAVCNSGNTAAGAYDPIEEIAAFCKDKGLWLHVDGAHGASAILSPRYRHYLDGISQADSVVWDAHKMLLMPALTSAVLFRNESHSFQTFSQQASYLFETHAGEEWFNLSHQTLECTKRAFALRLYFALYLYGDSPFCEYVTRQYDLARAFYQLICEHPHFESPVSPHSNIVCFRYTDADRRPACDAIQKRLRLETVRRGHYYIVQTRLGSDLYLRTTLMNPFTTVAHLKGLLDEIAQTANTLI